MSPSVTPAAAERVTNVARNECDENRFASCSSSPMPIRRFRSIAVMTSSGLRNASKVMAFDPRTRGKRGESGVAPLAR